MKTHALDGNSKVDHCGDRRECSPEHQPDEGDPTLTVLMPAFNETRTIEESIARVLSAPYRKQIIVVDDGSTDGTNRVVERICRQEPSVTLIRQATNMGKGSAIRAGLRYAKGRYTIIQDADLEYDPKDYVTVIEPLINGDQEVVFGSRYHPRCARAPMSSNRVGVYFLNCLVYFLYGQWLTDEATCYKAFCTDYLRSLNMECERFEFCPEVTAKTCRQGTAILEVPVSYRPRTVSQGKKIRVRDGWHAIVTLWKYRKWKSEVLRDSISRAHVRHVSATRTRHAIHHG